MKFPWPIRYTIPAAIFVTGAAICIFIFFVAQSSDFRRLEEDSMGRASRLGMELRFLAEHFFTREDLEGQDLILRVASLSPEIKEVMVVDDRGVVRHTRQDRWQGMEFKDTSFSHLNQVIQKAIQAKRPRVLLSEDRQHVFGIQSFDISQASGFDLKQGFIFVSYDLSEQKEGILARIRTGILAVLGVLFLICLAAWLVFYFTITARALKVARVARGISDGNYSVRSALRGSDELAELSRALDKTSRTIETRTRELEESNNRIQVEFNERKKAEGALDATNKQFLTVWKNSSEGMRLTDGDGTLVAVNDAFCRMVGMPEHALLGKPFTIVYAASENREAMLKSYRDQFESKSMEERVERRLNFACEKLVDLEITNCFIDLGRGHSLLLGIFRDITERKQAERGLMKLMDAQKLESLGVLAGGIAHDFNNLLTAILGNTSLALLKIPSDSPIRHYLQNVEKTSLQAADLCKQMLAYSGRGKFLVEKRDLNQLVNDLVHLLQVSIHKKISLVLDLAEDLPLVEVDPSQIRQVVMNLVINASEAIGERTGSITVRTGSIQDPPRDWHSGAYSTELPRGRYVFLEVVDTGSGMSSETKARIFDPFFTTKFTGRGLGLAAVLGIVRGHHGGLKVYSELGQGTTFKILLPCLAARQTMVESIKTPESDWEGQGTVLLIDDEVNVRVVAANMLETMGFSVLSAENGHQGVQIFRDRSADIALILLDMTMPGLNGEEAFREIKRLRADARVILISGYGEQDAFSRFHEEGLAGFLQKPFGFAELKSKIKKVLEEESRLISA